MDEPEDDRVVDARGLLCPLPVLRLRKALQGLPAGTRLRLITTDAAALIDVPHFCAEAGHLLVNSEKTGDDNFIFDVERGNR